MNTSFIVFNLIGLVIVIVAAFRIGMKVSKATKLEAPEAQNKKLVTVIKKLKEEYKFLKTCNKHPEGNSAQFNDMFEAAGKAAELTVDSSPM